jgi:Flp pilus assembly protein TadB
MRRPHLTSRLSAHVVGEFHEADHAWWAPTWRARPVSRHIRGLALLWWRLTARRRRTAELGTVIEHLAVLVGTGCSLVVGMDRLVQRAHGTVADELATVAGWIQDGQPPAHALRRWATTTACDGAGRLTAAVGSATSTGELAHRLAGLAAALRERAHHERMAAVHHAARVTWAATGLAALAALATWVP